MCADMDDVRCVEMGMEFLDHRTIASATASKAAPQTMTYDASSVISVRIPCFASSAARAITAHASLATLLLRGLSF